MLTDQRTQPPRRHCLWVTMRQRLRKLQHSRCASWPVRSVPSIRDNGLMRRSTEVRLLCRSCNKQDFVFSWLRSWTADHAARGIRYDVALRSRSRADRATTRTWHAGRNATSWFQINSSLNIQRSRIQIAGRHDCVCHWPALNNSAPVTGIFLASVPSVHSTRWRAAVGTLNF